MAKYQNLSLENADGILTVTINREKALNALNLKTMDELRDLFSEIPGNDKVSGVIVTGAGEKAFVAGADIKEFSQITEVNARKFSESGQETFALIEDCPKPVIAVVNGYALGGGCELAMACHMRIATANAQFGQPEVTLGIIPGYGGTQRLTQLVGKGKSMELTLSGNMVSAKEAYRLGLANYVLETKSETLAKAEELLNTIQAKAPMAIAEGIACVNATFSAGEKGYQVEANAFSRLCGTEDFKEGAQAFVEKRKPNFTGK